MGRLSSSRVPRPAVIPEQRSPRINLARSVHDVIDEIRNIQRQIEQQEAKLRKLHQKLDRLWGELCVIERALEDRGGGVTPRRRRRAWAPPPPNPLPVAKECLFVPVASGGTAMVIDGGLPVALPRALVALVSALKSGEGNSPPDELVPWKSWERISALLKKQLDRDFDNHAVSQLLTRLRKYFGDDRWLIQSSRAEGARLRLKLNTRLAFSVA